MAETFYLIKCGDNFLNGQGNNLLASDPGYWDWTDSKNRAWQLKLDEANRKLSLIQKYGNHPASQIIPVN